MPDMPKETSYPKSADNYISNTGLTTLNMVNDRFGLLPVTSDILINSGGPGYGTAVSVCLPLMKISQKVLNRFT